MTWNTTVSYCYLLEVPLSFLCRTDRPLCPQRRGCLASTFNSQKLIKIGLRQCLLRCWKTSLMKRVVSYVFASGHTFTYIPDSLLGRSILFRVFAVRSNLWNWKGWITRKLAFVQAIYYLFKMKAKTKASVTIIQCTADHACTC